MVYESRTYVLHPGKLPEYLAMFSGNAAVQQLLAPHLVGFWVAEGGELNAVHHLWQYEDRTARALARTGLAAQPTMQSFFATAAPLLQRQQSHLMWGDVLAPTSASTPSTPGVFDRVSMPLYPNPMGNEVQRKVQQTLTEGFQAVATLERRLFEQGGPSCELLLMLRSDSLKQRDERWAQVHRLLHDIDFIAAAGYSSQLLLPATFSPWR